MIKDMKTGKIRLILSFALLLTYCQSNICLSQQKYGDLVIGDKIHFDSKILNEQKTIVVIPPYNYKDMSNEKKMGVFPFIDALEEYAPEGLMWDYVHYKNESHNSLGFKSICAGFEMIYKNWKPENKKDNEMH